MCRLGSRDGTGRHCRLHCFAVHYCFQNFHINSNRSKEISMFDQIRKIFSLVIGRWGGRISFFFHFFLPRSKGRRLTDLCWCLDSHLHQGHTHKKNETEIQWGEETAAPTRACRAQSRDGEKQRQREGRKKKGERPQPRKGGEGLTSEFGRQNTFLGLLSSCHAPIWSGRRKTSDRKIRAGDWAARGERAAAFFRTPFRKRRGTTRTSFGRRRTTPSTTVESRAPPTVPTRFLMSVSRFYLFSNKFFTIFTGFYWVKWGFNEFKTGSGVLRGFTEFCYALLVFLVKLQS